MRRRELMLLLGGALTTARVLRAQQKAMPVVGYLNSASPGPNAPFVPEFHQGLSEAGYVEGQNVAIEYRWAEGDYDRLAALAADLVHRNVDVIAALGLPSALVATYSDQFVTRSCCFGMWRRRSALALNGTADISGGWMGVAPSHLGLLSQICRP